MRRIPYRSVCLSLLLVGLVALFGFVAMRAQPTRSRVLPGPAGDVTLLPNGWRISPAGHHVQVSDLPLNMILSPDAKYLVVTNNGYSKPTFSIVDTRTLTVTATVPVDEAWLGLAWHPDGKRFYSSAENAVREFIFDNGAVTASRTFPLGPSPVKSAFTGGLSVHPDGRRLFVVRVLAQTLMAVNIDKGEVEKSVSLAAEPYTCLVSPDGRNLYVSLWGGAKVLAFDAATLEPVGEVPTGEHPNALALSADGTRLFVACANTNSVWIVDTKTLKAQEQVAVSLYPDSPAGTTPNALALSQDGRTLLVANADNNAIAVVAVGSPVESDESVSPKAQGPRPRADTHLGPSSIRGFIPTGWYPTGVMFSPDGRQIYVLSGKGLRSRANPNGPNPVKGTSTEYVATLLPGTLSAVPVPDNAALQRYTSTVYSLTPYTAATRFVPADAPAASPIPRVVGDASPIKYVFYVIRENRTYDQVLGDMRQGNGDASITLFGEDVTPNAHKMSRDYVLFDNFYVNAEVSYGGHAYSTAAYSTDIVEKMWPVNYGNRGGVYLSEGGGNMRNPYGNIAAPEQGYIWDACTRAGISVRSYGEFVERVRAGQRTAGQPATGGERAIRASVPGLEGRINPEFPPFDMNITDQVRVDIWLKEFRQFEASGNLPRLSIIRLPRDHTSGARAEAVTPVSMVADNDLALGRMVEAISRSRFWKESAIFVLEDDAQNGPDHVDAHRSVLLVIGPFLRRTTVDSTLYTTAGVLRTMELILGLPPMTQLDAAATPLYNAFQPTPNPAPYVAEKARVPLDRHNPPKGPGAAEARAFDFEEADLVPDIAFSENVWKAVRGDKVPMPPPRRSVFVRELRSPDK
jgi:DNA-binding beta-propeller fold protein YncE